MRFHYGEMHEKKGISVFQLNSSLLKPKTGYESFKNVNAQFGSGAKLGNSSMHMEKLDSLAIIINSIAGIGFFILGFNCIAESGNLVLE